MEHSNRRVRLTVIMLMIIMLMISSPWLYPWIWSSFLYQKWFASHYTYIMIDKVQVMSWCDSHDLTSFLCQSRVGFMQSLMNKYKGIDHSFSVCWGQRQIFIHYRQIWRCRVLENNNVYIQLWKKIDST